MPAAGAERETLVYGHVGGTSTTHAVGRVDLLFFLGGGAGIETVSYKSKANNLVS
jgi:hypothetical protein